jgi:adiponectin receptor
MSPRFRTPQWRPFRAFMFITMGLSAVVPVAHGFTALGLEQLNKTIALPWLLTQGALYIVGASIYAARVPERWAPGRFDIVGSSHQIFHVLVLAAAAVHLVGLIKAFDYRHSQPDVSYDGLFDLPFSWFLRR